MYIGTQNQMSTMSQEYLSETRFIDYRAASIQQLIKDRGWNKLQMSGRIGSAYDFVRDEILFGYNAEDAMPASRVLADGFGQCNTKTILLMALLRALDVPCRFHGFTIDKGLQRGVVPELIYPLAPRNIIHSWVEVHHHGEWITLEGFILDQAVLTALQSKFRDRDTLCAYGAGTDALQKPEVEWLGKSTYIQRTGINHDFGTFADPDQFYRHHRQLSGIKGLLYRSFIRHWMNSRVQRIRRGDVPTIPGGPQNLNPRGGYQEIRKAI